MPAYPFPTNWEQDTAFILPDLIWHEGGLDSFPLIKHFPLSYVDAAEIQYDQLQNMGGLMPLRGLGSPPDEMPMPGLMVNKIRPGFYGFETDIGEEQITESREPNTINEPLDVNKQLGRTALNASVLIYNRIIQTIGTFAVTGSFTNTNAAGTVTHRYVVPNYQTFTPAGSGGTGPGWAANPAAATPITDLQYWQNTYLFPGTSADFGQESDLYCNPKTAQIIWNTAQVQSTFVSNYGASFLRGDTHAKSNPVVIDGKNSMNELFVGSGLPPVKVVRDGYYATLAAAITQDPTQFIYAIPDGYMFWAGKRPQGIAGALKFTKHSGIGAYQADRFPEVTYKDQGKVELAKGVYVVAEYQKMMPNKYRFQAGCNMAPFVAYARAYAGIRTQ
jgi:hypothetical protein